MDKYTLLLGVNGKNCNLELAEKLGSKHVFGPKLARIGRDGTRSRRSILKRPGSRGRATSVRSEKPQKVEIRIFPPTLGGSTRQKSWWVMTSDDTKFRLGRKWVYIAPFETKSGQNRSQRPLVLFFGVGSPNGRVFNFRNFRNSNFQPSFSHSLFLKIYTFFIIYKLNLWDNPHMDKLNIWDNPHMD